MLCDTDHMHDWALSMQEPDDQRLVDDDALSFPDLNEMEQATSSSAVTESTVNLTEDDSER